MRYISPFLIVIFCISCGISKEEHQRVLNENEQLKIEISELQNEIEQYKYGEERTIALIEQAFVNNEISLARQYINTFLKYHPQSANNIAYQRILRSVEQEEQKIKDATEKAEQERIRLERLANIGKTSDNPIVIDGNQYYSDLDSIIKNIVLKRNEYNGKYIRIINTYFEGFGISNGISIYGPSGRIDWYSNNDSYRITSESRALNNTMFSNNFYFFFHPLETDMEARRLMIDLNGKYYRSPDRFSVIGQFVIISSNSGTSNNIFNINSFTYSGKTYGGVLP